MSYKKFSSPSTRIFFWRHHRPNFFEGCGRGEGVLFIQKRISVGDYGGDDDDHDERPCRPKRRGREREGRVNGASGRTRSAGLCRLSLPVRRPPLLPHRKRGSGSSLRSFSLSPPLTLPPPTYPSPHSLTLPFCLTRSSLIGPTGVR